MGIWASILTFLGATPAPLLPAFQASRDLATQQEPTTRPRPTPRAGAGTTITSGYIDTLEFNSEIPPRTWHGQFNQMGIAGQMMREPHIRQSLEYLSQPITRADFRFRPGGDSELDQEVADFATWSIVECLDFPGMVGRVIRGYGANGVHLEEPTDKIQPIPTDRFPNHPGGGMGLVPTGFTDIPIRTVDGWLQDRTRPNQLRAIRQMLSGSDQEEAGTREIPSNRFIRWTYQQEGANFLGFAILRSVYGCWKLKLALQTIDAIKHERTGVGTPTAIMPEDASIQDINDAEDVLQQMRANELGYAVWPSGTEFDWKGAGEAMTSDINLAIQRCNIDIALNVTAGFMLLGLTGKTGSFALGNTQQGQFALAAESHAEFVLRPFISGSDGWNYVERIVRANYGNDVALPRLEARNMPTRDWAKRAEIAFKGLQANALTKDDRLERELRDSLQLPPLDPDTAEEAPDPMEMAAQMLEAQNAPPAPEPEEPEPEPEEPEEEAA